ncbi:hypothetical protein Pfo_011240 [Paulownia fortunei]|nr:hypothetical protein Pfo_011240 [Paulownia fortunei]
MDAEEKLTALKKAYADIILNISKEAAARIMSSERRAVRYQHELKVAQEEALRMLLRLKQMMDSKISEAEAASLNQQKKIEELEAQLQEAEDIVRDLREELGEVQAELERVKKDNLQHLNEPNNACSREMETRMYSYQSSKFLHPNSQDEFVVASDVTMPNMSQRNECRKCYSKIVCVCSSHIGNRDLPSIILRGKEPGLYRNGCTQRIRACERNLLDKELSLSGETDKVKDKNNIREQEEGEDTSKAPDSGAKTLSELEKKLLADIKLNNSQSFLQKRKRATRLRKTVTPLSGKRTDLFQKPDQLPELSARHVAISLKDSAHSSENPSKIAPILSPDKTETWTHLGCAESSGKETNFVEIFGGNIQQKDEGLKDKMVPLGEETGFAESSPDCKVDVEKVDMPSNSLEPNSSHTTKGLPSQSVRERVIKYTFQRKRKREPLSRSEVNASCETEKKTGDKKNGDQNLEQSKSSLLMESSRDSRRLAQVARQLISLSEKKWWN